MSNPINNKFLLNNAERLGIRDLPVIKKADEFLRILNSRTTVKTVNDIGKIILCLDLAATHLGIGFDKETGIKLSGVRQTVYQNSLNNFSKILDLDRPLTISELCVQLSCTAVKELAEDILKRYKENDKKIKDINHPQYAVVAVFTACRLKNIKVERSQFVALSRLKNAQWKELVEEFDKFVKILELSPLKKINKFKENDNKLEANTEIKHSKKKENDGEVEDYEVWRDRILKEATAAIQN